MDKDTVIAFFGSGSATARALGITRQAVSAWPELIPEGMAYKVESLTKRKLRVDPAAYRATA